MLSTPLVCIVDDQPDYRFLLQQLFQRHLTAYPVRLFAGGQALLDALAEMSPKPGLILLDRHMPGLDGYQTLLSLKAHPAYNLIPVVMMSGAASCPEIQACYQAGANSFLLKQMDVPSWQETLKTVCHYWLTLNYLPHPTGQGIERAIV